MRLIWEEIPRNSLNLIFWADYMSSEELLAEMTFVYLTAFRGLSCKYERWQLERQNKQKV